MVSTRRQADVAKKSTNATVLAKPKREPQTAPAATPQVSHDDEKAEENARLIAACVAVLRKVHPEGLQTKDLSVELPTEDNTLGFTSSVLSSKLNSFFRKYHGDSSSPSNEQLTNLPITRKLNTDGPKRLVYTWHKPSDDTNDENEEEEILRRKAPSQEIGAVDDAVVVTDEASTDDNDMPTTAEDATFEGTQIDEVPAAKEVVVPAEKTEVGAKVVASPEPDNTALFGPSPVSPSQGDSRPVQLSVTAPPSPPPLESPVIEPRHVHYPTKKRSHSVTFTSAAPATPPAEADEPVYKRRASFSPNKVNLYYDELDFDFSPVAGLVLSQPGELDLQDIEAPETLSPEDLVTMVV